MIGIIKKLISGIVSFLSGIVNFIIGLFGGKQESFYLELKEETESKLDDVKQAALNAKKSVEKTASKVVETTTTNTTKAVEAVTTTVTTNTQKAAEAIAETAPAATNGKKKSPKAKSAKAKSADVDLVQTAKGLKIEPATTKAKVPEQPKQTFAPDYLLPTNSNGRRRPGANMNSFLDMARQVKTPS
jgi:hypothetical protein